MWIIIKKKKKTQDFLKLFFSYLREVSVNSLHFKRDECLMLN